MQEAGHSKGKDTPPAIVVTPVSIRDRLAELYETIILLNPDGSPQSSSSGDGQDAAVDGVRTVNKAMSWEKFRKSLGHVEIDWDGLNLDRTLVPLRVWIAAEIENNGRNASRTKFVSVGFDEFRDIFFREISDLESNILEAVKLFRDLDVHQTGRVLKAELKATLNSSEHFSWEKLGVYNEIVDSHLFSKGEGSNLGEDDDILRWAA